MVRLRHIAIDHEQPHPGENEHRDVDVEHRDAGLDEPKPIGGEQRSCRYRPPRGTPQSKSQQVHDEDGQGAEHRAEEAPAERLVPEQLHPGRDEPFADRRMHNVRTVLRRDAGVALRSIANHVSRVGDVMNLVRRDRFVTRSVEGNGCGAGFVRSRKNLAGLP